MRALGGRRSRATGPEAEVSAAFSARLCEGLSARPMPPSPLSLWHSNAGSCPMAAHFLLPNIFQKAPHALSCSERWMSMQRIEVASRRHRGGFSCSGHELSAGPVMKLRGPLEPRLTWGCTTHWPQERLHQLQVINRIPRQLTCTFTAAWQVQADGSPCPSPTHISTNSLSPHSVTWGAAVCPGCVLRPGVGR